MSATPPRRYTRLAASIVIAGLTISASALAYSSLEVTVTKTVTDSVTATSTQLGVSTTTVTQMATSSQTTTSATSSRSLCISPGQPLGVFLRVLNDSTSLPVVGANVTALANGYSGNCGIATVSTFTWQSTYVFITNSTEWYPLNLVNVDSYQFTVSYLGQTYNFHLAPLGLSVYTCGTMYLPSGKTNMTTSHDAPCGA
jgi:hypothetical protein